MLLPPNMNIGTFIASQRSNIKGSSGSLTQLLLVTGSIASSTLVDTPTFIERLPTTMPAVLSGSLSSNFLLGYEIESTPQPFIIFKTTSYDNAYGGMLHWEETLETDMDQLNFTPPAAAIPDDTSTTTPQHFVSLPPSGSLFQDGVVSNTNVRLVKDANGDTRVIYALPDTSTIVITTNETAMKELLRRLKTTTFVQ